MNNNNKHFWIREEIFEFGIQTTQNQKEMIDICSFDQLLKLKNLITHQFEYPYSISLEKWIEICTNTTSMTKSQCNSFYNSFSLFKEKHTNTNSTTNTQKQQFQSSKNQQQTQTPEKKQLSAIKLLVFVYLHNFHTWIKEKESTISLDQSSSMFVSFVKEKITEILMLVCSSELDSSGLFSRNVVVGEQFDLLGFMFAGGVSYSTRMPRISWIVPNYEMNPNKKIEIEKLIEWIKANLTINTFSYPSISNGNALQEKIPLSIAKGKYTTHKLNLKSISLFGINQRTILKSSKEISCAKTNILRVVNCLDSQIYLLSCLKNVRIVNCKNSTIFVGPSTTLMIENCENVNVVGISRFVRISNSKQCKIDVWCSNFGTCQKCQNTQIGPFNSHYFGIDQDLKCTNIQLSKHENNKWNQIEHSSDCIGCSKITPEQFFPFSVPFVPANVEPKSFMIACELPPEFSLELKKKIENLKIIKQTLSNDKNSQQKANESIESEFQNWLKQTGLISEIQGIVKMQKQTQNQTQTQQITLKLGQYENVAVLIDRK